MFLKTVRSEGLAHNSYVVGDAGQAAVIDPRRDCEVYLEIASREAARIAHIFETHRNEDYVVGSQDLANRSGAEIYHGSALPFGYGRSVSEGDSFKLGDLALSVLETPGHTDESISLILADTAVSDDPVAVFTGDSLFIGDVGRTDFFPDRAVEVAGLLHDSLFNKLLALGDHVIIYPAHGAGSVCGGGMADREFSSIGYERMHNPALQVANRDAFIRLKLTEHHYQPPYFRKMEEYNLNGAPPLDGLPLPKPTGSHEFAEAMDGGMIGVDVRSPEAFAGAHLHGGLALPMGMIASFAGWFLPYDRPLGLIGDTEDTVETAVRRLVRLGYDRITAVLSDGLGSWESAGLPFHSFRAVCAHELKRRLDDGEEFTLLDVRGEDEFRQQRLPGSTHVYVGEVPDRLDEIPRNRPLTTFCGSGSRALVAASVLQRNGIDDVEVCLGSMHACLAVGCPVCEGPDTP